MSDATGKPSQAEGEDPQRPPSGDSPDSTGKPSQAEGDDRLGQDGDDQVGDADSDATGHPGG